jgi:hypothetical protein
MTPHTPGKLTVRASNNTWPMLVLADAVLEPAVAQVDCSMKGENRKYAEACANAERLALCWNEHDDLKAEIERIKKVADDLSERALAVAMDKDELLTALKGMMKDNAGHQEWQIAKAAIDNTAPKEGK